MACPTHRPVAKHACSKYPPVGASQSEHLTSRINPRHRVELQARVDGFPCDATIGRDGSLKTKGALHFDWQGFDRGGYITCEAWSVRLKKQGALDLGQAEGFSEPVGQAVFGFGLGKTVVNRLSV